MRKVTYLAHSGFYMELETCGLVFDYVEGKLPSMMKKPLYVFVSHSHTDHYNEERVETLRKQGAKLILSDDIKRASAENLSFVHAGETLMLDDLRIQTLASTDVGVAFLVEVEGMYIYHAGDLNWWHWEEESSEEENEDMKQAYLYELAKLKGYPIDIAFVPVDPRLNDAYVLGIDAFMREVGADKVFPMHFWKDYRIFDQLKTSPKTSKYRDRIVELHYESEEFKL